MGLWNKLTGELVDIVEWIEADKDEMVHRFERYQNEIKNGAKLVCREGQAAVFINMGTIADVFMPGMYELTTNNLPILSTLQGWKYGFNSPFKAEVYFVTLRQFTNLAWGTKNPIMMNDPTIGPVRLRAFGNYSIQVTDPKEFIRTIVGTDGSFTKDSISEQLRTMVVSRFTDAVAESKVPVLDLAAKQDELAAFLTERIQPEFNAYGLKLCKLLIENVSLPPEVEKMLDKRSSMGILGDMNRFQQFQMGQALETAAANPNGLAGSGMGMGMGFAMAGMMGQQPVMQPGQPAAPASPTPPPIPQAPKFFVAVNGAQTGPFEVAAFSQGVAAGIYTGASLVWKEGMAAWTPAAQVPELAGCFAPPIPTPPPIPKP